MLNLTPFHYMQGCSSFLSWLPSTSHGMRTRIKKKLSRPMWPIHILVATRKLLPEQA